MRTVRGDIHLHPQVTYGFHSTDFSLNSPITRQMFCGHLA